MARKPLACAVAIVGLVTAQASFAQYQTSQSGTDNSIVTPAPARPTQADLPAGGAAGRARAEALSSPVVLGLAGAALVAGVVLLANSGKNHTTTTTSTTSTTRTR